MKWPVKMTHSEASRVLSDYDAKQWSRMPIELYLAWHDYYPANLDPHSVDSVAACIKVVTKRRRRGKQ